jgi:hypothetical protein
MTKEKDGEGSTMVMPTQGDPHGVALFIDWDNLAVELEKQELGLPPSGKALSKFAQRYGRLLVARAYANWNLHPYAAETLFRVGIDPVFALTLKNSADVRLAIDCCQLALPNPAIQTIVIASGDGDLVYLIDEAHRLGKRMVFLSLQACLNPVLTRLADETMAYETFYAGYVEEAVASLKPTRQKEIKQAIEAAFAVVKEAVAALCTKHEDGSSPEHDAAALKHAIRAHIPDFEEERLGFERFRHFLFAAELRGLLRVDTKGEPGRQEYPVIYEPNATRNDRQEPLVAPKTWRALLQFFSDRVMSPPAGTQRSHRELPIDEETLVQRFGREIFEAARRSGFIRPNYKGSNKYVLSTWDERVIVYRAHQRQSNRHAETRRQAPTPPATPQRVPAAAPLTHRPFEKLQTSAEPPGS